MAQIQFAAGASRVRALCSDPRWHADLASFRTAMREVPRAPHHIKLASAHVMGGSCMGEDPRIAACDSRGRYHHLENLSVLDGSLFPTSVGANPQLSIYALVARLASALAAELAPAHRVS
jgi:choline dehydrogenase-like flavoprotein